MTEARILKDKFAAWEEDFEKIRQEFIAKEVVFDSDTNDIKQVEKDID